MGACARVRLGARVSGGQRGEGAVPSVSSIGVSELLRRLECRDASAPLRARGARSARGLASSMATLVGDGDWPNLGDAGVERYL